jgi:hypothetical protein
MAGSPSLYTNFKQNHLILCFSWHKLLKSCSSECDVVEYLIYLRYIASFLCVRVTDSVKRNWPTKEDKGPKRIRTAICECLKHAAQRQARCDTREEKQRTQNEPELDFGDDVLSDSV